MKRARRRRKVTCKSGGRTAQEGEQDEDEAHRPHRSGSEADRIPHTPGHPRRRAAAPPSERARRSVSQETRGRREGDTRNKTPVQSVDNPVADGRCGRSPHRSRSICLELNARDGGFARRYAATASLLPQKNIDYSYYCRLLVAAQLASAHRVERKETPDWPYRPLHAHLARCCHIWREVLNRRVTLAGVWSRSGAKRSSP